MCDYSLMAVPNRLAQEGEDLVAHRFPTGSLGLASPCDLKRISEAPAPARRSFWCALKDFFNPPKTEPVPAVCIPPGARLNLRDLPVRLQRALNVRADETVTFTQLSAAAHARPSGGPALVSSRTRPPFYSELQVIPAPCPFRRTGPKL